MLLEIGKLVAVGKREGLEVLGKFGKLLLLLLGEGAEDLDWYCEELG